MLITLVHGQRGHTLDSSQSTLHLGRVQAAARSHHVDVGLVFFAKVEDSIDELVAIERRVELGLDPLKRCRFALVGDPDDALEALLESVTG